ncbi:MAG: GAF domain-containing protein [Anaerolineales bacterium]|nr:GAF domain-containing protein [Anaerolineales bacterium]
MDARSPLRSLQIEVSRLLEENRQLRDEINALRSSLHALSAIQELLNSINPETDVVQLLDQLLSSALLAVGAEDGSLLLLDDDSGELVFVVVHGSARDELTGFRLPPRKGIAGWVAATRTPIIVKDVQTDPRFFPQVDETFGFHTNTLACVPLVEDQRVLGVIEAINKSADAPFSEDDHDLLMIVSQLAALAIAKADSSLR